MKSLLSSKTFFPSTSTPSSLTVHLPLAGSLNWIHQNPFQFWHLCLIASILSTDFFSWIMQHLTPGPKICLLFIKLHPCCCWSQTNNWFLSIMFCFWDHLFLAMQNSCSFSILLPMETKLASVLALLTVLEAPAEFILQHSPLICFRFFLDWSWIHFQNCCVSVSKQNMGFYKPPDPSPPTATPLSLWFVLLLASTASYYTCWPIRVASFLQYSMTLSWNRSSVTCKPKLPNLLALCHAPGSANITKIYHQAFPTTCQMTNLSSFEDPQSKSLFTLTLN